MRFHTCRAFTALPSLLWNLCLSLPRAFNPLFRPSPAPLDPPAPPCSCGAMSHKTKDCLERPRGKGAKYTNKNIAADEKVEDIKLVGFESKRDRWNGYDAQDYSRIMDRFEQLEEMRKEIRKKEEVRPRRGGGGRGGNRVPGTDGYMRSVQG